MNRDRETFDREVQAAARLGRCVVQHFKRLNHANGWNGGDDGN